MSANKTKGATPGTVGHQPPIFNSRAGGQQSCRLFIILPHVYNEAKMLCQEVIFKICHAKALFIQQLQLSWLCDDSHAET